LIVGEKSIVHGKFQFSWCWMKAKHIMEEESRQMDVTDGKPMRMAIE
jgi:hypothetical protein